MANLQLPLNQDHEVLGSEYCSGYVDALGKWNTGFYCPASDESQDVFCCGSDSHKYCCTKKDQVIQAQVQDLTVVIGIIVGASAAILILTAVSCFCCSCCLLYKKRNPNSASLYRLHNTPSDHSGVTNMYSLQSASNTGNTATPSSRAETPLMNTHRFHYHQHPPGGPGGSGGGIGGDGYLDNEFDTVRVVPAHNGGISHSFTLPHNLSHQHHQQPQHQHQQQQHPHQLRGSTDHLLLGGNKAAGRGVVQQYMAQHDPDFRLDNNPDLIASVASQQQQQPLLPHQRPYATMGRQPVNAVKGDQPPPPYNDPNTNYAQLVFQQQQQGLVSIIGDNSDGLQMQQQHEQQQKMVFPHQTQQQQQQTQQQPQTTGAAQEEDATLFHSTKF